MGQNTRAGNRLRTLGIVAVLGIIVLGALVWWFLIRDTSAASVDSVAAAEAREEAIAEAAASSGDDAGTDTTSDAENNEASAVDSGQADSAASVGSPTDGLWAIDSSIGTFDASCLEAVCSSGFVGFRINEELAGFGAKTVVGRSPAVTGTMQIAGSQITTTEITVDMTQVITDDTGRTSALKSAAGGLETVTFPTATFVLTEPIELGNVPVEGSAVQVNAVGDLTVHGVTNQVSIPLTAELQAGLIVVFGSLEDMVLADYGIPKPTSIVVLSVEEIATMELQLFFSR